MAPKLQIWNGNRQSNLTKDHTMKLSPPQFDKNKSLSGRVSLLLLWLVGVPVPILVIIFLFRGCSG
jgi:hypothetical protein